MTLTCQFLLKQYAQPWQEATHHPFLSQCQSGAIQAHQFNTWLVQDYWFVVDFTRMAGRLLAVAPIEHFDVLLGGLTVLKNELNWFRLKSAERHLELAVDKQPTCQDYCTFMSSLGTASYAVQATAFWAIECAYNQGWRSPGTMSAPYGEFAERWGNQQFSDYVCQLEQHADEALQQVSEEVQQQAERAFLKVAQLEQAFWQMAYYAPEDCE